MRSSLTGLFAAAALLLPSDAKAAMQILCSWEGRSPLAITVEGDATDLRYHHYATGGSYYDIEVTRSGIWLLGDEPKRVLSIRLLRSDDQPISVVFASHFAGGRCWR